MFSATTKLISLTITAGLVACSARPLRSPLPTPPPPLPSPPLLSKCLGQEKRNLLVGVAIGDAGRTNTVPAVRSMFERVADNMRGDDPDLSASMAAELIRLLGPSANAMLVLGKVWLRRAGDATDVSKRADDCGCFRVFAMSAKELGADVSKLTQVGTCP